MYVELGYADRARRLINYESIVDGAVDEHDRHARVTSA